MAVAPSLLCWLGVALVAGCAHAGAERLSNGDYRVRCETPLAQCLEPASRACTDRGMVYGYDVVRAQELVDLQGGQPYTGTFTTSQAVFRCRQAKPVFGKDPNVPLADAAPSPPAPPPAPAPAPRPPSTSQPAAPPPVAAPAAPASAPRCVPGVSLACANPNGCTGAQICAPDGASFGPCQCATAPAPAPSSSAPPR